MQNLVQAVIRTNSGVANKEIQTKIKCFFFHHCILLIENNNLQLLSKFSLDIELCHYNADKKNTGGQNLTISTLISDFDQDT